MVRFSAFLNILLLVVLATKVLYAQDINEQLEFKLSNDKFADDDRYFTNGLYFTYRKALLQDFILPKTAENRLQLNISIGNEIYSPTSLSSIATSKFDRPFAGWLFSKLELGAIKEKSAFFLAFETGITGKESLAGNLQIGLHNFFGIDSRPTWIEQIEFKWLFNLKTTHVFNWALNNASALQYRISPSLGTKDIYLENDISYFFGRLNAFQNSARTGIVDTSTSKEFFGYLSVGHRYVVHNTLVQGSLFTDDVLFTTDSVKNVFKAEIGAVLQSKGNTFKILYNFNTKETPISTSHIYGSVLYARSF